MPDDYRPVRERKAAFDRLRIAEFEIQRRQASMQDNDVPAEWWDELLRAVGEYVAAVKRCRG
jgi:hypothetical protein